MQTKAKCNDSLKCFLSKAFTITQVIIVLTWWGVQTANHTPEWGNRITSQQAIGLQLSHGNNEKFRLFLVPQITVTEVTLWLEMHSSGLEVERMGKWAKGMLHIDALKFFGTFIKQQEPQWSVYLSLCVWFCLFDLKNLFQIKEKLSELLCILIRAWLNITITVFLLACKENQMRLS